jgi:hypothetical protein
MASTSAYGQFELRQFKIVNHLHLEFLKLIPAGEAMASDSSSPAGPIRMS